MNVSSQDAQELPETGPRARTRKLLLETAMQLMQAGRVPSVTDVAEAAEVSRATAYRYFPTQAALVQAAVGEALGPILEWRSDLPDAQARVADLLAFAYPRIDEYEATLSAALLQAMDQWSRRRAGTLGDEAPIVRGNRRELLTSALAPLRPQMAPRGVRPAAAGDLADLRDRGFCGPEGHMGAGRRQRTGCSSMVGAGAGARGGRRDGRGNGGRRAAGDGRIDDRAGNESATRAPNRGGASRQILGRTEDEDWD